MGSRVVAVFVGLIVLFAFTATATAGPLFVATVKNLRGAMYLGYGPTPGTASEQAMSKCTQDSFIPPTCKIECVRMDVPPPPPMPVKVKKKRIRKVKPRYNNSPYGSLSDLPKYSMGMSVP
jgi:hypothetical protein